MDRIGRALVLLLTFCGPAFAQNHTFVLSGGGNPFSNHFSQYLQTRTLTLGLRALPTAGPVEVRFGAGNNDEAPKLLADVFRVQQVNGETRQGLIYGVIPGNLPATKVEVNRYFETLSGVRPEDTFFLFVSDHGMPNEKAGNYEDNCINLWDYDADTQTPGEGTDVCLSKSELSALLSRVPAKRKVFAMSQCFSGGFHQMSVTEKEGYPTADPGVCGFTATTEDETASGCTPDVDGPGYKGYERFFTQQLIGKDVVSGRAMPYNAKHGLKAAHLAASLEDTTKDMPLSTSDYYLIQWADSAANPRFVPRTRAVTAEALRTALLSLVSGKIPTAESLGLAGPLLNVWQEKADHLQKTVALLSGSDAELGRLLRQGTAQELHDGITAADNDGNEERRDGIRRVFLYRRALAGVLVLSAMRDEKGLNELMGLIDCESASL